FRLFSIAFSNIIAIIALERHHVIVNPLASPLPTKLLAFVGWFTALLLSLPQAFVFKVQGVGDSDKCLSTFSHLPRWHLQMYIIYGAITVFFAPFCILCGAYIWILWTIWRKEQHVKEPMFSDPRHPQKKHLRLVATNSTIPRAKIKTLKMTLVIIILFIVCGLPYFIIEMKMAFGSITQLDDEVIAVLGIFVVSNSAVNPYVYLFFKTDNVYLKKLEKKVCFSCLKDYKESTFHRDLLVYNGKRPEQSTTTSDTETTTVNSITFLKPASSLSEISSHVIAQPRDCFEKQTFPGYVAYSFKIDLALSTPIWVKN
ncbi:V1AR protein, partial [Amia calva]|nr:V1AR protein [Amia calva]